jgi:hypothetical protein
MQRCFPSCISSTKKERCYRSEMGFKVALYQKQRRSRKDKGSIISRNKHLSSIHRGKIFFFILYLVHWWLERAQETTAPQIPFLNLNTLFSQCFHLWMNSNSRRELSIINLPIKAIHQIRQVILDSSSHNQ